MLNRRFLRIKVLQQLYAYHQSEGNDLPLAERQLLENINALYELFIYHLSFWVEVKRFAEQRIEENKRKIFPTEDDLNPNMRFVENRVLATLEDNKHLQKLENAYKINWADHRDDFIRSFYNRMVEYPEYHLYMESEKNGFNEDRGFLLSVVDRYFADDSSLYDFYADRKLTFNSDYQMSVYLLWKFLVELTENFDEDSPMPTVFKTENDPVNDDKEFVLKLFEKTILHRAEYRELVEKNISNWDYDRLALMDKIIIFMALTEFCEFRLIPVKVTINEYVEISKYFSTPESRRFVNGMLDKMAGQLKECGKLKKVGLGLNDR